VKRGGIVVLAPIVVVALVVIALVVQPRHHSLGNGEADLSVDGSVLVTRADGQREVVDGRTRLHSGDTFEVKRGTAHVATNNATYQARASIDPSATANRVADTRVRMAQVPELLAGELLVEESTGAIIDAGGTAVAVGRDGVSSAAKLSRTLVLRVSVYRGAARIDSAGSRLTVTRLRSAEVVDLGQVPVDLLPVTVTPTDAWDREFLQTAIDINNALDPLTGSFDSATTGQITPAALRSETLPTSSESAVQSLLVRARDIDPTLNLSGAIVGAAVASLGKGQSFDSRWDSVFHFHAQSASWGLVAMDQYVERDPLLARVRAVIDDQNGLPFQTTIAAGPTPGPPVVSSPTTAPGASPSGTPTPAPATSSTPTLLPPVTVPPVTTPPVTLPPLLPSLTSPGPNGGSTPLQGVVDGATTLLSGLLNALVGPSGLIH